MKDVSKSQSATRFGETCELDQLDTEQQERLADLLDRCIQQMDQGQAIDRVRLMREHPDLADQLHEYLESLECLQEAAAGFHPDTASASPLAPEREIGDFRIVREIGRGGMGVVYEARQISLDRAVALKVLPFAGLLTQSQIARFRNEAHAAAQLVHPRIVPVYAIGSQRGLHYFAMQLIDGCSLEARVTEWKREQATGDFASSEGARILAVVNLGIQAAETLHAAHQAGVVHRDIKPSNLMLDQKNELWVMDFGLARCRSQSNLTQSGDLVGTMRYMSPEQSRGEARFTDQRTDVYSLGATLYEMLTLKNAVRGTEPAAIIRQLDQGRPYPLRSFNSAIPADLENVVLKAMASAPEDRYLTAQELADDLQRFASGKPTAARRATLAQRGYKWAKRHHRFVAASLAILVVAVFCLIASNTMLVTQKRATEDALEQATKHRRRYERQLAVNYNQLAVMHDQRGDRKRAIENWNKAIQLHESLARDETANDFLDSASARQLAASYGNLSLSVFSEDPRKAMSLNATARQLLEDLPVAEQREPDVLRELALAHANWGALLRKQNDNPRAIRALQRSIDLYRQASAGGGEQRDVPRQLAVALSNLALAMQDAQQDPNDISEAFAASVKALKQHIQGRSADAVELSCLGGVYNNWAMAEEKFGRLDLASDHFASAVQFQQAALQRSHGATRFERLLQTHVSNWRRLLKRRRWSANAIQDRIEDAKAKQPIGVSNLELEAQPLVKHANESPKRTENLKTRA